ncbi:ATP-dependent helicase BRM [Hibiscus syriacus]|uniref:ATP-dependent helicase BRM n=1 Tax=Hibiscus syriacus TaxID=106335 RepID=A0A6A3AIN3_HIBSY|nr:ATP-dependent helicase BRM [Hibiscus syriacus]
MVARKFLVRHDDSTFSVDYDTDDGFEVFQFQLFSLTSIPPDEQEIAGEEDDATSLKEDVIEQPHPLEHSWTFWQMDRDFPEREIRYILVVYVTLSMVMRSVEQFPTMLLNRKRALTGEFKGANPSLTVNDSRTRHVSGTTQIRWAQPEPGESCGIHIVRSFAVFLLIGRLTPHMGFDSVVQQQQQQQQQNQKQQQQQISSRQSVLEIAQRKFKEGFYLVALSSGAPEESGKLISFQQPPVRKPEGNEAALAYQASGLQRIMGGSNFPSSPGSMQPPQPSRNFFDLPQQHSSAQGSQNRSQGVEQQMLNPVQQAYYQFAHQAAQQQKALLAQQQQAKMAMLGSASVKNHDTRIGNLKMQDLISMQAANQAQSSSSKNASEQLGCAEKHMEQGPKSASEHINEPKPPSQATVTGQLMPGNVLRAMQAQQAQQAFQNVGNNQLAMAAQLQAWALERNIDLSQPANANLMAQLIPLMQSRMAAQQKTNERNMGTQSPVAVSKPQITCPSVPSESSPRGNSSNDISGMPGFTKARQTVLNNPFGSTSSAGVVNNANNISMQQLGIHGQDNQMLPTQPVGHGNELPPMHPPQSSANVCLSIDPSLSAKNSPGGIETPQMQHLKHLNRSSLQPAAPTNDGGSVNNLPSRGGAASQMPQQRFGFTKQQLHVLKAQILAFRRLKKGEGTLPQELLRAIVPPPLEQQQLQLPPSGGNNQGRDGGKNVEDQAKHVESKEKVSLAEPSIKGQNVTKEEAHTGDDGATESIAHMQGVSAMAKELPSKLPAGKEEQQISVFSANSDQEVEHGLPKALVRSDFSVDRGKAVSPQVSASDGGQVKKPVQAKSAPQPMDPASARKYHGPLFDFPFFTRKHDSYGSAMPNSNNNLSLAYGVKDLLFEEAMEVLRKKRSENLRKIGGLLAINMEKRRIRPDLVLRLQIEEKKLQLKDLQTRLRDEIDQQQQEIMAMPDRPYRKFVRLCERQRSEMTRQVQATQKALREKQLKSIFQWRKKLLEAHWAIRDARTACNRGVAKYHERMLREFSKRKDDDRNRRMEALKNNDVERYREMLIEQQTNIPGDAAERYEVLSSFLSQTEEYLHKLGSKITAAKNQQEVADAANAAAVAARLQAWFLELSLLCTHFWLSFRGLSEEEVRAAASCAGEEVMIRNRFMEMNAPREGSSVSKYYNLAHAVNERVIRQPSMLRAGKLRDYQLVGLQWMLSLYNNKLNGILADEMGLGKTVQVMALIAYLMEFKGNYGPHLIIVPNAVLVNWKSELHTWLPSVSCIYYVGGKDQRSKLFSQEVLAMKFNVLVTTYEFIMYDRSKLSKIDWKYIIIDEAQRMKDRESVLARDLDRYRCQRRLLLTGTPLQVC